MAGKGALGVRGQSAADTSAGGRSPRHRIPISETLRLGNEVDDTMLVANAKLFAGAEGK